MNNSPGGITLNPNLFLNKIVSEDFSWITKNTAIIVMHGMGYQLPLETLDQFGRGLIKQYRTKFNEEIYIEHDLVKKQDNPDKYWLDNVLRIRKQGSEHYIDVYEYYWANYTEDKATWNDINKWLEGVVKGAKSFYNRNAELGKLYKDKSPFFDKANGNFKVWRYRAFITIASQLVFIFNTVVKLFIWLFTHIPLIGKFAADAIESYTNSVSQQLTNLLGDLVAYNVVDPKSKFYCVRTQILEGAVKSLQYLIEKTDRANETDKIEESSLAYSSVIVAGHSLGSQIAYDAINRINLMVNMDAISTYNKDGISKSKDNSNISQQLNGFITFGSPLDKVVFFLRENIPDEYYIRQQFLDHFHGFKQRDIDEIFNNSNTNKLYVKAAYSVEKYFDDVKWRNYYDDKDYVSGGLDYYQKLTNVNCQFKASQFDFTHSHYWACDKFYEDIICNYLN